MTRLTSRLTVVARDAVRVRVRVRARARRHWARRGVHVERVGRRSRARWERARRRGARSSRSPADAKGRMRILLTGGAGFIGSHVAERLASRHAEYTVRRAAMLISYTRA